LTIWIFFIGATAIANNMILVTDNEKHLKRLSNIRTPDVAQFELS